MSNPNYDIWAIQNHPEEVHHAIAGLEDSRDNILYNNLRSIIRIGNRKLPIQFNTALFSDDKERLVLLMRDGEVTPDQFRNALVDKKVPFNEITYLENRQLTQEPIKELWFAVDKYVLDEALRDSKSKGIDVCDYYPDLGGCLELRHLIGSGHYVSLFKQPIRGAVVLDDKIVLLLSRSNKRGIKFQQAISSLYEYDMTPRMVVGEQGLPGKQIPKQYKKEQ